MKDRKAFQPSTHRGAPKGAPQGAPLGASQGGPPGGPQGAPKKPSAAKGELRKKRRVWVQPKDKSLGRKHFLQVRDSRARSVFEKLQKKEKEKELAEKELKEELKEKELNPKELNAKEKGRAALMAPVASASDNDAFLEQLMNPFAKPKQQQQRQQQQQEAAAASAAGNKFTDKGKRGGKNEQNRDAAAAAAAAADQAAAAPTAAAAAADAGKSSLKDKKGYMPFLKAQREFEMKQKAKEEERLARLAEAEKERKRKNEKRKLNKITHRKLQARTKKGQIVMGNVVEVLLQKMHRNAQKK
ncbi:hypothetical protein, conserved [Eimeria tenella]|uniref:rRNA processing protein n=1 Tax=Eimeria tenella TaxID=5802 RepID=U6KLL1_EIMTE|nr:hypothetical protein, conserved [Eimeria tenella]CDJ38967.1 hypothetical protein, conserved [Eimeria tenella]|eukprot:XP_013229722.1 hypothetical protein, conserved [Eimeria tenella]